MIKIDKVIEALEFSLMSNMDPMITPYFDRKKQEFVYFDEHEFDAIIDDDNQYIGFYEEIYSNTIIESFILTINDTRIKERMFDIFRGKGKYSRIKNYFYTLGLEREYYKFRDEFIKEKAIEWCKENNISYEL
ncbi:MAG: UPF0158 family protein [Acholeplasmataceae bacterium]|nr:UPF0158 family protein [Acholeplasmataceae bacterium]